jgi:signal peptidase II
MMKLNSNWRIAVLALGIYFLDQVSKWAVLHSLYDGEQRVIIPGFFNLVHWVNTGAAWSMFHNRNELLAVVSLVALLFLFLGRHHFDPHTTGGQVALGLIFGGILGNLTDRLRIGHVVDFLYFYVIRRDGTEAGFPAFNVADSAICIGVGLLFVLSWKDETTTGSPAAPRTSSSSNVPSPTPRA